MVSDVFSAILKELAQALEIADLQPDQNHSCLIRFPQGVKAQLELDKTGNFLMIGSTIGDIPRGPYRENLFREALRANGMPFPRYGNFAYSRQADKLVLIEMMHLKDLTGEKVFDALNPFLEKAKIWSEAVSRGEIPVIESRSGSGRGAGVFGLKP